MDNIIYIWTQKVANNQDFFGLDKNILIFNLIEKIKVCRLLNSGPGSLTFI